MTAYSPAESLHRLVKQALDSGAAASIEEAEALFRRYRLSFVVEEGAAHHPAHQMALLTGVALARRVFLGGVTVTGSLNAPLLAPLPFGDTLGAAVEALGGHTDNTIEGEVPMVSIGGDPRSRSSGFHLRTVYAGWRGGVIPAHFELKLGDGDVMPLAPMLAAGLAVSEAFFHIRGETPVAGHRPIGLSLWRPDSVNWFEDDNAPSLQFLPSRLWVIGLGHLGQAYLWALGLLPYPQPTGLEIVLQDVDLTTPSTESTSILTDGALIGAKKTRAMAAWAERRGFGTVIYERLFDASFKRQESEPAVALCGLDNALGRRALDLVGFPFVVEAGLGRGHRDFQTIRLHTLPGTRSAAEIWNRKVAYEDLTDRAAYRKLISDGALDRCGVTLLAGKAVGAPFVGSIAACLAISEVLRLLHGGTVSQLIDLDLQSLEHRTVVSQYREMGGFNPGFVTAAT